MKDYAAIVISRGKAVELELELHIAAKLTLQNLVRYVPLALDFSKVQELVKPKDPKKPIRFSFGYAHQYFKELKRAEKATWFTVFDNKFLSPIAIFNDTVIYNLLNDPGNGSLSKMRNFAAHPQKNNWQNITKK